MARFRRFGRADLASMPHTRTLHMTREDMTRMRAWLEEHSQARWCVTVRPTKRARATGVHSVRVHLDDANLWPQFRLTWT